VRSLDNGARPLISVLVASRERPALLAQSLASLGEGDFEVLVRVDRDDPRLDEYLGLTAQILVGARHGYTSLHEYYNELAFAARGHWLFLWNDDCFMQTPNWIDVVRIHDGQLVVLNPDTNHDNWKIDMNVFPLVPRKMVELMGHFSLSLHNDSWVEDVARQAGIMVRVPIRILHDRADLTGNNRDAVYAGRRYETGEFHSTDMVRARERDARVVLDYLARRDLER
jgi:hypothetical protein